MLKTNIQDLMKKTWKVGVLEAVTGIGKSRSALKWMIEQSRPSVMIVPTKAARLQLQTFLHECGVSKSSSSILITTPLHYIQYRQWKKYEILVIDEYHTLGPEYETLFQLLKQTCIVDCLTSILLLSANSFQQRLDDTFGPNGYKRRQLQQETAFPITIMYDEEVKGYSAMVSKVVHCIQKYNAKRVMVFLSTKTECDDYSTNDSLIQMLGKTWTMYSIHSGIPDYEIERYYEELVHHKDMSCVIFCTNMLQTSVTIPNIDLILDTGYEYRQMYSQHIERGRIDKASFTQRAGRTGRTCPGTVVRFIREDEYTALPDVRYDVLEYDWKPMIMLLLQLRLQPETVLTCLPRIDTWVEELVESGCVDRHTRQPTQKGYTLLQLQMDLTLGSTLYHVWNDDDDSVMVKVVWSMVCILQYLCMNGNFLFWIPKKTSVGTLLYKHIQEYIDIHHDVFLEKDALHSLLNIMVTAMQCGGPRCRKKFCQQYSCNNKVVGVALTYLHSCLSVLSPWKHETHLKLSNVVSWMSRQENVIDMTDFPVIERNHENGGLLFTKNIRINDFMMECIREKAAENISERCVRMPYMCIIHDMTNIDRLMSVERTMDQYQQTMYIMPHPLSLFYRGSSSFPKGFPEKHVIPISLRTIVNDPSLIWVTLWTSEPLQQTTLRTMSTTLVPFVDKWWTQYQNRQQWKEFFQKTVIEQIDTEVAWRPDMVKFLDTQDHFLSLVHKWSTVE